MKKILKYALKIGITTFTVYDKSDILTVQMQHGKPTLWLLSDEQTGFTERSFNVYGTGHLINMAEVIAYVGTVQDDLFVWHVFEIKKQ